MAKIKFFDFKKTNIHITPNRIIWEDMTGSTSKPFTLTYDDLMQHCQKVGYRRPQTKESIRNRYDNEKSEYYSRDLEYSTIPYICFAFYYHIWLNEKIPSFEELVNLYMTYFCDRVDEYFYTIKPYYVKNKSKKKITFTKKALQGKIARSYNSFMEELQLLLFLQSKKHQAEYNFHSDVLDGLDILVWDAEHKSYLGIAEYLDSKKANEFKAYKNSVHNYGNQIVLDVKANQQNRTSVNGVMMFTTKFLENVYENILDIMKDNQMAVEL